MLDVVRISAIVAVVGIHCLAPAATAENAPWAFVVFRSMLNAAVPVFIMISGALNLAPLYSPSVSRCSRFSACVAVSVLRTKDGASSSAATTDHP